MKRIAVGPQSAGSDPGPVAYGRGGTAPTVTDADLILGRLDPDDFAGGAHQARRRRRRAAAIAKPSASRSASPPTLAAYGIGEIVDENMANAARVHAVENGRGRRRPHPDRVRRRRAAARGTAGAEARHRPGDRAGARRASARPSASCTRRSRSRWCAARFMPLDGMDRAAVAAMYAEMDAVVRARRHRRRARQRGERQRTAYLRYVGQGHEVPVERAAKTSTPAALHERVRGRLPRPLRPHHRRRCHRGDELVAGPGRPRRRRAHDRAGRPATPSPRRARSSTPRHESLVEVQAYPRAALADGQLRSPAPPSSPKRPPRPWSRAATTRRAQRRRPPRPDPPDRLAGDRRMSAADRHPQPGHVGPPDRRRRGAGAGAPAHRLLHHRARGGRPLRRRLRPRGPHAGPGGHRHARSRQLHGRIGQALHRHLPRGDDEGGRRTTSPTIPGAAPATSTTSW